MVFGYSTFGYLVYQDGLMLFYALPTPLNIQPTDARGAIAINIYKEKEKDQFNVNVKVINKS